MSREPCPPELHPTTPTSKHLASAKINHLLNIPSDFAPGAKEKGLDLFMTSVTAVPASCWSSRSESSRVMSRRYGVTAVSER